MSVFVWQPGADITHDEIQVSRHQSYSIYQNGGQINAQRHDLRFSSIHPSGMSILWPSFATTERRLMSTLFPCGRQSELTDYGASKCDVASKTIGPYIEIGVDRSIMGHLLNISRHRQVVQFHNLRY